MSQLLSFVELGLSQRDFIDREQAIKKDPACAVYCGVLNLLSQVGSDLETPPWLKPIALFHRD